MSIKYKAAISDTDILIHFAKINRLDILELLFDEIIVPFYILDRELKNKAGKVYGVINNYIHKPESIFVIKNRHEDSVLNSLSKEIIEEKKKIIGAGESECAGYASALRIPIIISDNHTEFQYLDDEFILLNYGNILTLCVHHKQLTSDLATNIFDEIKGILTKPTNLTFGEVYKRSLIRFKEKEWNTYLQIQ